MHACTAEEPVQVKAKSRVPDVARRDQVDPAADATAVHHHLCAGKGPRWGEVVGWLVGWVVSWSVGWSLAGWSVGWWVGRCVVGELVGWWVGCLVGEWVRSSDARRAGRERKRKERGRRRARMDDSVAEQEQTDGRGGRFKVIDGCFVFCSR